MGSDDRTTVFAGTAFRAAALQWLLVILLLGWANSASTPASAAPGGFEPWISAPKRAPEIPRVLTRPLPTELETDRFDVVDAQWHFDGPAAVAPARSVVYPPTRAPFLPREGARSGAQRDPRLFDPRGPPRSPDRRTGRNSIHHPRVPLA